MMKYNVKVGDTIFVDNNETFKVIPRTSGRIDLVDLNGMVDGTFMNIGQVNSYLQNVYDTVEVVVEDSIVTNEVEYIDNFDDEIYLALQKIGKMKGYNIKRLYDEGVLTNEMLGCIRSIIVDYLIENTANHIDLSPPHKEYKLGDKVSLYYDGLPTTATIVLVDFSNSELGLLIDDIYQVRYIEESDSPTNYIIELQKRINVE